MSLQITQANLEVLGWPKLTQAIGERTQTEPGLAAAQVLGFASHVSDARHALEVVAELMALLELGAQLPLEATRDIRPALAHAQRGATLSAEALIAVGRTAEAASQTQRHLRHHEEEAPCLADYAPSLGNLRLLAQELAQTFDEAGEVSDEASPELAAARRQLIQIHRDIKAKMEAFLARSHVKDVLQDQFYTVRDERYVIPVISSFQGEIDGILHGGSRTGETVFIEPSEFISLNNRVKVAESQVLTETMKVLAERSAWVRQEAAELRLACETLIMLDLAQAKARLGRDLEGSIPTFGEGEKIFLKSARNPLLWLKGTEVVANDILLEEDRAFVVITGPNTGGKTVTLNTVATCLMLAWAGCPIPADEGSALPAFSSLWALIGDAQDIDRDLSTFSGHLVATQAILDEAAPGALVLLDELIVGTDPAQGAALAIAVLESLANRGARGFVTTHYERLKTLALEDTRFDNAAVSLDPKSFEPTYRLVRGRAGSSNPYDAAHRLGFPPHIITRAKEIAGGHSGLSLAFEKLEKAEQASLAEQEALRQERVLLRAERLKVEKARQRLETEARVEVENLAAKGRAQVDGLLEELRVLRRRLREVELGGGEARAVLQQSHDRAIAISKDLKGLSPAIDQVLSPKTAQASHAPILSIEELAVGHQVWVKSWQKKGVVTEISRNQVVVALGPLKTTLDLNELGKVAGQAPPTPSSPTPSRPSLSAPPKPSPRSRAVYLSADDDSREPPAQLPEQVLDIRGVRRDEVLDLLEPFIDEVVLRGLDGFWIIHGMGTGALKAEVRDILGRSSQVTAYRPGRGHEGGEGVTIAFLS